MNKSKLTGQIQLDQLFSEVKKLKFEELRQDEPDIFECVMHVNHLELLNLILKRYFGDALKSAGETPTKEAQECAQNFGGISSNQTLYYLNNNGFAAIAMIWPWNDKTLATIKVLKI